QSSSSRVFSLLPPTRVESIRRTDLSLGSKPLVASSISSGWLAMNNPTSAPVPVVIPIGGATDGRSADRREFVRGGFIQRARRLPGPVAPEAQARVLVTQSLPAAGSQGFEGSDGAQDPHDFATISSGAGYRVRTDDIQLGNALPGHRVG